jgi:4-amino-4-deoxy-L-arabinose transferase-like glycosyltransferase
MTTLQEAAPSLRRRAWPRIRIASIRPELAALVVLAAVLNLWALSRNGWANDYYSAAVRSMTGSWHNFLYESFDPSGVMTVDKPPLALWVQALSARVFGFNSLALLVPQALMGAASVALVYDLVRRRFGRIAGAVGGLVLALTPISVAISRHNNPDALLVLCCVAALWFFVRALETGKTKWLVLTGVAIGLGFETKMLVALMVLPGILAAWVYLHPRRWRPLLAGLASMTAVGLAWPVLMWVTPASDRPWISGTSDNSIWSLIFGYNGLGRIDGQAGGPGGGFGGNGGPFGGSIGILRLLNQSMGGQAGWLLGVALVSGVAVLVATRMRRDDARTGWLIAVGGAFLTTAVAFSFASGIFHPYYVSLLAPFTAALVGAGASELRGNRVPAALAILLGMVVEIRVLQDNPGHLTWLPPLLVAGCALACGAMTASDRVRATALAAVLALLLIAPAAWSVQTLSHATSGTFPAGGPADTASGFAGGPPGGPPGGAGGGGPFGGQDTTEALAYVSSHGGGTMGVSSQTGASSAIIENGAKVAGLGGFSGRESEVSVSWLADAVKEGRIRWVVTNGGAMSGPGADGRVGASKVMSAVSASCKATSVSGLYDCRGADL